MINCGDFMNYSIIFLIFVAVAELVFIIQHNYQASITLLILAVLFSGLFFLSQYRMGIKSIIASFAERWKPPHMRVKEIKVGSSEAPNSTVIRVETKDKEIHTNAGNRIGTRNPHSTQTNTSCTIPIINNRD